MTRLHTGCYVLLLALGVCALPARVPKVYNALITSGQNLSPSKAYPIYQPVFHETYGLPLQPAFYFPDEFKNLYSPNGLVPVAEQPQANTPEPASSNDGTSERPVTSSTSINQQPKDATAAGSSQPPEPPLEGPATSPSTPPPAPATQSPITLNEFGLPPSLVPFGRPEIARPTYSFDPYANFAPYYPQFDPYSDPYGFRSVYPLLPPVYRLGSPGSAAPSGLSPDASPLPPTAPPSIIASSPADSSEQPRSATPPPAPIDLDLKNYMGKDRSIPDVPPPDLPSGGFTQ